LAFQPPAFVGCTCVTARFRAVGHKVASFDYATENAVFQRIVQLILDALQALLLYQEIEASIGVSVLMEKQDGTVVGDKGDLILAQLRLHRGTQPGTHGLFFTLAHYLVGETPVFVGEAGRHFLVAGHVQVNDRAEHIHPYRHNGLHTIAIAHYFNGTLFKVKCLLKFGAVFKRVRIQPQS